MYRPKFNDQKKKKKTGRPLKGPLGGYNHETETEHVLA